MKTPNSHFSAGMLLGVFAVLAFPLTAAAAETKPEDKLEHKTAIPVDLRGLQVGVQSDGNDFTAPSIAKVFDTLQFLMPLPVVETARKMPARMPENRADLAIELGFLIADGFMIVQAEQLEKVEELAKDLTR
jgi:hypothetical protein